MISNRALRPDRSPSETGHGWSTCSITRRAVAAFAALAGGLVLLGGAELEARTIQDAPLFSGADLPQWTISPEPQMVIGEDEQVILSSVDAALLLEDHIVIADGRFQRLEYVSLDGSLVFGTGRAGDGPGDFRHIADLVRLDRGRFAVWDPVASRVSVRDSRGDLLDVVSVRFEPAAGPFFSERTLLGSAAARFLLFEERPRPAGVQTHLEERRDAVRYSVRDMTSATTDQIALSLSRPGAEVFYAQRGTISSTAPVVFGRNSFGTASGSMGFVLATNDRLEFTVFDPRTGDSTFVSFRHDPIPVREEWVERVRDSLLLANEAQARSAGLIVSGGVFEGDVNIATTVRDLRDELLRDLPAHSSLPAFSDLRTDIEGNVWVRAYPSPDDTHVTWAVLDGRMTPVALARLPADLDILDIGTDRLLSRATSDLGEPVVLVWALSRSQNQPG